MHHAVKVIPTAINAYLIISIAALSLNEQLSASRLFSLSAIFKLTASKLRVTLTK